MNKKKPKDLVNIFLIDLPRRTSGDEGWCLNMANRLSARLIEVAAPASELSWRLDIEWGGGVKGSLVKGAATFGSTLAKCCRDWRNSSGGGGTGGSWK